MTHSVTVGTVRSKRKDSLNIRVDRSSPLGNPFYMANESMRDTVCKQYAVYFDKEVVKDSALRTEVIRIFKLVRDGNPVNLQCHCAPRRCHADHIKQFILNNLTGV